MIFIGRFAEIVTRHPDAIAVLENGHATTYRDLSEQAHKIAAYLHRQGVKAESLVGLHIHKSKDYIAALLGVWIAGGAFVPLDPELPPERKKYILSDCRPDIILTEDDLTGVKAVRLNTVPDLALP